MAICPTNTHQFPYLSSPRTIPNCLLSNPSVLFTAFPPRPTVEINYRGKKCISRFSQKVNFSLCSCLLVSQPKAELTWRTLQIMVVVAEANSFSAL